MSRERALTRAKLSLAGAIVVFGGLVVAAVATGASVAGLDAGATRTVAIGLFLTAVGGVYAAFAEILTVWLAARMEGVDVDAVAVSDDDVAQRRRGALLMLAGGLVVVAVGLL